MKKKIILALTVCLFAAGSIINMHLAQNNYNTDISLADISIMAQAETEQNPPGTYTCYTTWKGTWIGGWHIVDCYTCTQKRVSEYRDQGSCSV